MVFIRLIVIVLVFFLGLFALRGPIQNVDENLAVIKEHYIDPAIAYAKNIGHGNASSSAFSIFGNSESATDGDRALLGQVDGTTSTSTGAVKAPSIPAVKAGTKPVLVSKDNTLTADSSSLTISGILAQTNKERAAKKLGTLKLNTNLNSSAQKKLEDMFANQYFEHVSPAGVDVTDLVRKAGYEYIVVGENLALGNF